MRLPAIPVHSFEDATLNAEFLEQLGVLGSVVGSNVQAATGTVTLTFTASTSSNVVTVTHGLGRVPIVVATPEVANVWLVTSSKTATSFQLQAFFTSAITLTVTADWLAIG